MQGTQNGAANPAAPSTSTPASGGAAEPRLGGIGNGRTNGEGGGAAGASSYDDDLVDGADDGGAAPAWGENWRQSLAKGDAARLAALERYADPTGLADALFQARDRLMRGAKAPILPDDATDAEIKEFRKAQGIPDKASDYGLAWPEGRAPSEADNLALAAFGEFMHAKHIAPAAAKAAFEFYTSAQEAAQQQRAEAQHEMNLQQVAELRREYPGREFKRNMTIAEEFLAQHFEGKEEALDMVLEAYLPNNVQVKNFAPFIMGLVEMARTYADDQALIGGDGSGGGKSLEQEYKELTAIAKPTQQQQDRALQIQETIQARGEKQGRRMQAA